jgi:succinate--hydroxymethylglutarate CoA-transferase
VDFGDRSSQKVNRNKKSVALNFKHEESLAVLNKIIDSSDVIVENYIPGTLKKYGLDYPTLSKRKPGLVYASITGIMHFSFPNPGYGQTGPYALRAGYDVMVEAEMGLMHITGITKVEFG